MFGEKLMFILKNDIINQYPENLISAHLYSDVRNLSLKVKTLFSNDYKEVKFLCLLVNSRTKEVLTWNIDDTYAMTTEAKLSLPEEATLLDYELMSARCFVEWVYKRLTGDMSYFIAKVVRNTLPAPIGAINMHSVPYVVSCLFINPDKVTELSLSTGMKFESVATLDSSKFSFDRDRVLCDIVKEYVFKIGKE